MALRICCDEADEAQELFDALATSGYAAEVTRERFAGEDDDEAILHVVSTDAPAELVGELIEDSDAWLEISDPMSGTSAAVESDELPTQPRKLRGTGMPG